MANDELSLPEVICLIESANARRTAPPSTNVEKKEFEAEHKLNAVFDTNNTLAVYGTLAPGLQNYHIVEPLGGEWTEGLIDGDLQQTGWGSTLGYPAFRPRVGGPTLRIRILKSKLLSKDWARVDEFEGPDYQRILVPVFNADDQELSAGNRRLYTVANLYAANDLHSLAKQSRCAKIKLIVSYAFLAVVIPILVILLICCILFPNGGI